MARRGHASNLIATPLCVFVLAGCALDDPPEQSHAEQAAATPFSQELARALADNFVSSTEWNNRLAPLAQQLPRTASSDTVQPSSARTGLVDAGGLVDQAAAIRAATSP